MSLIDFPTSPSVGQTYTFGTKTWSWNGIGWIAAGGGPTGPTGPNGTPGTGGATGPTGQTYTVGGRLTYSTTTTLLFKPYNGGYILINGTYAAIPAAGITGLATTGIFKEGTGSSNLTSSTLYYVYAFLNSGVVTADFSTTAHSTSATAGNVGTEIKTGDDTRSLIGMCYVDSGLHFGSTAVLSWFNRKNSFVASNVANNTTTSVTYVNFGNSSAFLAWGDENIQVTLSTFANSNTAGQFGVFQVRDDNSNIIIQDSMLATDTIMNTNFYGITAAYTPSQGLRTLSLYAESSLGTNSFSMSNNTIGVEYPI